MILSSIDITSISSNDDFWILIPFLLFYCAKNNVVQPFRLVYKSQAGSLGYNSHLIMRNGIKKLLWRLKDNIKSRARLKIIEVK